MVQQLIAVGITALIVVAVTILIALGKVDGSAGLAIIAALGGVHGGAVIASSYGTKAGQ